MRTFVASLLCAAISVSAEPYLAVKTNSACDSCHVNPLGGGARNDYGAYYGTQLLPQTVNSEQANNGGRINEYLQIGADLRANYQYTDTAAEDAQGFDTQSGQLYLALQPKHSRFSLYLDQQIAPGSSFSREAFVMVKLSEGHHLKFGKMILPYGWRIEDDSAYIRQASQMNFDNSDNGVEWQLTRARAQLNLAITNGSTSSQNNDDRLQYLLRGEYLGDAWRIGASVAVNDAALGQRRMANLFGGFQWRALGVLAEVDHINDESQSNTDGEALALLATLLEFNLALGQGYNLKLTSEYFDPDDALDENERARHSLVFEYTPFAYLQVRAGLRENEDIPQRDAGNFTALFIQGHLYF